MNYIDRIPSRQIALITEIPIADTSFTLLNGAESHAMVLKHTYVSTTDLVLAAALVPETAPLFHHFGTDHTRVIDTLMSISDGIYFLPPFKNIGLSPRVIRTFKQSVTEAKRLGDHEILPEHLLLAISRDVSMATVVLEMMGMNYDSILRYVIEQRSLTSSQAIARLRILGTQKSLPEPKS